MFETSNFLKNCHPVLPSNIWIFCLDSKNQPFIKIQRSKNDKMMPDDSFIMTISEQPTIIGDIGIETTQKDIVYFNEFIRNNKSILLDYWNGNLDTFELTSKLMF